MNGGGSPGGAVGGGGDGNGEDGDGGGGLIGGNKGGGGQLLPSSGSTIAKQYPRSFCPDTDDRPPKSTVNDDVSASSNAAIAGSDDGDGVCGLTKKSVATFTFCVDIAYSAPDGEKVPPSSVDDDAIVRLDAPITATNS